MAIGKSLRFEIFARDGFVCQYCGQRPPDVVLEVDHIHPRSKDGADDPINLITSCFDCNRGKGAKILGQVAPRPDSDLAFLKTQQEIAEAERYLQAKEKKDGITPRICACLSDIWKQSLSSDRQPDERQFTAWLLNYSPDEIEYAIRAAAPKFHRGDLGKTYLWDTFQSTIRYVAGILRSRSQERSEKAS